MNATAKIILDETETLKMLREDFKTFRTDENYADMGAMFWTIFLEAPEGSHLRKTATKLWKSLTDEEREMCEGA